MDRTISATYATFGSSWAVVEYLVPHAEPMMPPLSMLIIATPIKDVFNFIAAKTNSEWLNVIHPDHRILVIFHAVGDKAECIRESSRLVNTRSERPRCNLYGYNVTNNRRPILCSNGATYASQSEAADALGIRQSAISKQLRGTLRSAGGYTFNYV